MTSGTPDEGRTRLAFARVSLAALGAYAILLALSMGSVGRSDLAYWIAIAALVPVTAVAIRASGFPLAFFGITWRGTRASVHGAVVSSALLAAVMAAILLLAHGLDRTRLASGLASGWRDPQLLAYILLATPLQELIFRGLFQNSARYLLGDTPRAPALAIACSTIAFALSHLPFGGAVALVMILPGLVWGIQYERDRTLVGVMLSHAVVGYLFVGATPLWRVITAAGSGL